MPEDRSLDEFAATEVSGEDADPGETEPDEAPDDNPSPAEPDGDIVEDPTPATPTATWTTDGADCERCGDRVERRWLDDGDRVCPDCKTW